MKRLLMLIVCMLPLSFGWSKMSDVTMDSIQLKNAWSRYMANDTAVNPATEFPHDACFRRSAAQHDVPLTLLIAVARGESDFDPNAVSKADAVGVMQILWPGTARHLGITEKERLFDPCTNIDAGARYLRELLDHYQGDAYRATAAYNYGPGRIDRSGSRLPQGAKWYSGYIHNHLTYVLGRPRVPDEPAPPLRYADEKRTRILVFHEPYRAEAFVKFLRASVTGVRLDWFDIGLGRYSVALLHKNRTEHESGRQQLKRAGFSVQ